MLAEKENEAEVGPQLSAVGELLGKGRLKLMLSVLVIELAIFFAAMLVPIDAATREALLGQANTLSDAAKNPNSLQVLLFIATNNVKIALVEFLPVLGVLVWIFTIYTTGQVVQVIAASSGLPGILAGYALFLFPFAILELSAYAVAVGSGIMLLAAWRRKRLRREVRVFLLEVVVVLGMLVVAAAMETATLASSFLGFALWIPVVGALVAGVVRLRRASA